MTQGFFVKVLEKRYIEQADRERGKFRVFLLSSFKNYLANEWDRTQALKRGGGHGFVSLDFDDAERRLKIERAGAATPEILFARQWAWTLLNRVLDKLRGEMASAGSAKRFDRLKSFLTGTVRRRGRYDGETYSNFSITTQIGSRRIHVQLRLSL